MKKAFLPFIIPMIVCIIMTALYWHYQPKVKPQPPTNLRMNMAGIAETPVYKYSIVPGGVHSAVRARCGNRLVLAKENTLKILPAVDSLEAELDQTLPPDVPMQAGPPPTFASIVTDPRQPIVPFTPTPMQPPPTESCCSIVITTPPPPVSMPDADEWSCIIITLTLCCLAIVLRK